MDSPRDNAEALGEILQGICTGLNGCWFTRLGTHDADVIGEGG